MDRLCERDPWFDEMKSNKRKADMRQWIADGDYGLPLSCPCGGRMIADTSTEEKYLICNVFKNDGLHFRKLWTLAIEEEVTKLRTQFDGKFKEDKTGIHELCIKTMQRELENNAQEIANLKEMVGRLVVRIEKLFGPLQ